MFRDVKDIEWDKLIEELRTYAVVYEYENRIVISIHSGNGHPDFIIYMNPTRVYLSLTDDMKFAYSLECWSNIDRVLKIINEYLLKDGK